MSEKRESLEAVAGPVSRETFLRMLDFEQRVLRWGETLNLVAPSQRDQLWERHVLDSAQLLPLLRGVNHMLDLGSGAGFPGAVLAILLSDRPSPPRLDLVESTGKKAAFLRTSLAGLAGINVHDRRIEACYGLIASPDIVTARALAALPDLLRLAEPWLTGGARGLFQKGRDYRREVEESRDGWEFDLIEHRSRIDPAGAVLEIGGLKRRA